MSKYISQGFATYAKSLVQHGSSKPSGVRGGVLEAGKQAFSLILLKGWTTFASLLDCRYSNRRNVDFFWGYAPVPISNFWRGNHKGIAPTITAIGSLHIINSIPCSLLY